MQGSSHGTGSTSENVIHDIDSFLSHIREHLISVATPTSNLARLTVSYIDKQFDMNSNVNIDRFVSLDSNEHSKLIAKLAVVTQRAASLFDLESSLLQEILTNIRTQIEVTRANKPELMTQTLFNEQFIEPLVKRESSLQQAIGFYQHQHTQALDQFKSLRHVVTRPVISKLRRSRVHFENTYRQLDDTQIFELRSQMQKIRENIPKEFQSQTLRQIIGPNFDVRSPECLRFLYQEAVKATDTLKNVLKQIASQCGVTLEMGSLKSVDRAMEKAIEEYEGDFSRLLDIARGSLICEDIDDMLRVARSILELASLSFIDDPNAIQIVRVKHRLDPAFPAQFETGGYRDILMNVNIGSHICEIQLQLISFLHIKKAGAHRLYTTARSLHLLDPYLGEIRVIDKSEYSSALDRVAGGSCQTLHLDFIRLEVSDCEKLREALQSDACFLQTIALPGCGLNENTSSVLVNSSRPFGVFRNVLLFNNRGLRGACVTSFISNALEVLDLLDCYLDHENSVVVCKALKTAKPMGLRSLSLGGCDVRPVGAMFLAEPLANTSQLTSLDLYRTSLGASGAKCVVEAIKKQSNLTALNLAKNRIGDEGIGVIGDVLRTCDALTTLDLGANELGHNGFLQVLDAIKFSRSLLSLGMGADANLTAPVRESFTEVLERNKSARSHTEKI